MIDKERAVDIINIMSTKEDEPENAVCEQNKEVNIKNIMLTCGIEEVAFCDFGFVADKLLDCRAKARLPQNAKTVIMALFPYKVKDTPPTNISRYAAVPDYHIVCGKMLEKAVKMFHVKHPQNKFEWFIDNSPIPEVAAAAHCGLGAKGKNGLLINEKYGSFVFIGEIVTDLELKSDFGDKKCLDCSHCISSCPSNMCKEGCLSSVNQRKKEPNSDEKAKIRQSGCIWGCDICSEVCPMNKDAHNTYIPEFLNGYRDGFVLGEDSVERAYTWRGEQIIRRNYEIVHGKDELF